MKAIFVFTALFLLGWNQPEVQSPNFETTETDSIGFRADNYLSALTKLNQFNGVVLLKKNGKTILSKAYNISDDTSSTLHVSTLSQFDLRSVAKLFAEASIIELEHENVLSLDDPLSRFLPDFPNGDRITINHLLNHSSGLPREMSKGDLPSIDMTPEVVIEQAAKQPLEFEPGIKRQYSNVGYQLLYYIIGQQSGSSFVNFLRETYFSPLGMVHTGSNFDDSESIKTDYAHGHYVSDNDSILCECSFPEDEMRMGNLYSTANDLDLFLSSFDRSKAQKLLVNGSMSHAGGTRGKRAYIERNFNEDQTIIFLTNYDQIPFEKLVTDLQNLLKNKQVEPPKRIHRTPTHVAPSILKKYAGTYDVVNAGHLILTIKFERDSLFVYQKGQNNGVLYPESDSVFFGDPASEESIEFVRDSLGDYHMLVDFQGVRWKGRRISE